MQSQKVPNDEVCSDSTLKRLVELLRSQQPSMAQAAARIIARTCTSLPHQTAACAAGAVPALAVSYAGKRLALAIFLLNTFARTLHVAPKTP